MKFLYIFTAISQIAAYNVKTKVTVYRRQHEGHNHPGAPPAAAPAVPVTTATPAIPGNTPNIPAGNKSKKGKTTGQTPAGQLPNQAPAGTPTPPQNLPASFPQVSNQNLPASTNQLPAAPQNAPATPPVSQNLPIPQTPGQTLPSSNDQSPTGGDAPYDPTASNAPVLGTNADQTAPTDANNPTSADPTVVDPTIPTQDTVIEASTTDIPDLYPSSANTAKSYMIVLALASIVLRF